MLNLTDEQVEAAAKAMFDLVEDRIKWDSLAHTAKQGWRDSACSAARHLQAPWPMLTEAEMVSFVGDVRRTAFPGVERFDWMPALEKFISRRNAALLPKPVDARRDRIAAEVQKIKDEARSGPIDYVNPTPSEIADRILAALDGKEGAR